MRGHRSRPWAVALALALGTAAGLCPTATEASPDTLPTGAAASSPSLSPDAVLRPHEIESGDRSSYGRSDRPRVARVTATPPQPSPAPLGPPRVRSSVGLLGLPTMPAKAPPAS
jgi:hypothetical protein